VLAVSCVSKAELHDHVLRLAITRLAWFCPQLACFAVIRPSYLPMIDWVPGTPSCVLRNMQ
jgi:hypothetical protein